MAATMVSHYASCLFTDEAQFTRDGITNTCNSQSRPHEILYEVAEFNFQHRLSVDVWCGVLGINLILPHVIEERLTVPHCRNFLENEILLQFRGYASCNTKTTWLQHDGAPPHLAER
jgi:hypothetical protein